MLKRLSTLALVGLMFLGQGAIARPSTFEDGVNNITDEFWWQLRPDQRERSPNPRNALHVKEWNTIRRLVRSRSNSFSGGNCFDGFSASFRGDLNEVADAVYKVRFPSAVPLNRIRVTPDWRNIRRRLSNPNGVNLC